MSTKKLPSVAGTGSVYTNPDSPHYKAISKEVYKGLDEGYVDVTKIINYINNSKTLGPYRIEKNGVYKVFSHMLKDIKNFKMNQRKYHEEINQNNL